MMTPNEHAAVQQWLDAQILRRCTLLVLCERRAEVDERVCAWDLGPSLDTTRLASEVGARLVGEARLLGRSSLYVLFAFREDPTAHVDRMLVRSGEGDGGEGEGPGGGPRPPRGAPTWCAVATGCRVGAWSRLRPALRLGPRFLSSGRLTGRSDGGVR